MEDFLHTTRQSFGMAECKMNRKDCKRNWKFVGTLSGECLMYSPGNKPYPKDAEFRFSVLGNTSGKSYFIAEHTSSFLNPSPQNFGPKF